MKLKAPLDTGAVCCHCSVRSSLLRKQYLIVVPPKAADRTQHCILHVTPGQTKPLAIPGRALSVSFVLHCAKPPPSISRQVLSRVSGKKGNAHDAETPTIPAKEGAEGAGRNPSPNGRGGLARPPLFRIPSCPFWRLSLSRQQPCFCPPGAFSDWARKLADAHAPANQSLRQPSLTTQGGSGRTQAEKRAPAVCLPHEPLPLSPARATSLLPFWASVLGRSSPVRQRRPSLHK